MAGEVVSGSPGDDPSPCDCIVIGESGIHLERLNAHTVVRFNDQGETAWVFDCPMEILPPYPIPNSCFALVFLTEGGKNDFFLLASETGRIVRASGKAKRIRLSKEVMV